MLIERFAGVGVQLTAPDLTPGTPGTPGTQGTPGEEGFERSSPSSMLAVVERLLAEATPPHMLIGSSLGGYLAAVAASRNPGIERLVLLVPAFRLFERWEARLTATEREAWRTDGLEVDHFASGRRRRLGWQFHEDARGWPAFPEVRVPALCFAGRRDEVVPAADVEAFVARTPSARFRLLDDGHELLDSLDVVFHETRAFLAEAHAGHHV